MDYGSAIVTYIILWWITFLCLLPVGVRTAEEEGGAAEIGHATSAPTRPRIWTKIMVATSVATVLFVVVYVIVDLEIFSFHDWVGGDW